MTSQIRLWSAMKNTGSWLQSSQGQSRAIKVNPGFILLEHVGRNTAPAIGVAALKIMENDSEAMLLVLPADHVIENIPNFYKTLEQGNEFAAQNNIITFGIIPQSPETGYGYIQKGDALDGKTL